MDLNKLLLLQNAQFNAQNIEHFGDLKAELAAVYAKQNAYLAPLLHLSVLDCIGEEADKFLQNQLTNDVFALKKAGELQLSAWCSPKGRVLANFILLKTDAGFRLILSADLRDFVQKRLSMFIMRTKAKLVPSSDLLFGVTGKKAASVLATLGFSPPTFLSANKAENATLLRYESEEETDENEEETAQNARFMFCVKEESASALWEKLSHQMPPIGLVAWRALDILRGVSLVTQQTSDAFVPQMLSLDKKGAVSFKKGCYPGQEIVARVRNLGKIKRHLYRVSLSFFVAAGTTINALVDDNLHENIGAIADISNALDNQFSALCVISEEFAEAKNARQILQISAQNTEGKAAQILSLERV